MRPRRAEARAIGVHQIFTLVVEPIRDPRLGRNEEAFSEDPFLCSRIAETIVRSVQGDDVLGPRQGRLRALPLSRSEPAGQRPGTRGHGDLRTHLARGVSASLGGGHQEGGALGRDGDLSGHRWRADACLGEAPDAHPAPGAGLRRPGALGGGRHRHARLRGTGAHAEGSGSTGPGRRRGRRHLVTSRATCSTCWPACARARCP